MIAKVVKKANNRLQKLYFNNLIVYPRVEKSYSTYPQSLLSHKPLPVVGNFLSPFYKKTLPFNKKTSLLFLNTAGYITPSLAYRFSQELDIFFDDDMKLRGDKELNRLIEAKNIFLSEHRADLVTKDSPNLFRPSYFNIFANHKPRIKKVKIPNLVFAAPKKKRIDDLEPEAQEKIVYDEAIFDLKRLKKYIPIDYERDFLYDEIDCANSYFKHNAYRLR